MKDEIAAVLEDFAGKIRALEPFDDHSIEKLILNYWEFCIAKTVETFKQHGIEPGNLMYLLMGVIHEAVPGSIKQKDDAMMQMALKYRITDGSPQ